MAKIQTVCMKYSKLFSKTITANVDSLILWSVDWGNGKTYLASAICHDIIDRWVGKDCPVLFVNEPDLFTRIQSTYKFTDNTKQSEDDVYRELTSVPLLVIDDVGKEERQDPRFVQRVMFKVINGRYEKMLPVVITANLNMDGLLDHLGGNRNNEATFNRLIEMSGGVFWQLVGDSYREKNK